MGLVFFIHSNTLCLLIGGCHPCTFDVITDSYVLIAILLLVFWASWNWTSVSLFRLRTFSVIICSSECVAPFSLFFFFWDSVMRTLAHLRWSHKSRKFCTLVFHSLFSLCSCEWMSPLPCLQSVLVYSASSSLLLNSSSVFFNSALYPSAYSLN